MTNLTKDEKHLLETYRRVKQDCQIFQSSEWSVPAAYFDAPKGAYVVLLRGEYNRERD